VVAGCFGVFGSLVAEAVAEGHFHAAFFIGFEALGGDDVAFFDDVSMPKAELR
jgi:hypothetical protein